jgi:hypothetical protein
MASAMLRRLNSGPVPPGPRPPPPVPPPPRAHQKAQVLLTLLHDLLDLGDLRPFAGPPATAVVVAAAVAAAAAISAAAVSAASAAAPGAP